MSNTIIDARLPRRDRSQGEPRSFSTLDGKVSLFIDIEAYDFHIDALPGYNADHMAGVITQAEWWGLEVMDEDECPAELLSNGATRIYLTPMVPVEVTEAEAVAELVIEANRDPSPRLGLAAFVLVLPLIGAALANFVSAASVAAA